MDKHSPTNKEILLYPAFVWADNEEGEEPYSLYEQHKNDPIGTEYYSEYGAPVIGGITHKSTRVTEEGIFAIVIKDTGRILEPWECE